MGRHYFCPSFLQGGKLVLCTPCKQSLQDTEFSAGKIYQWVPSLSLTRSTEDFPVRIASQKGSYQTDKDKLRDCVETSSEYRPFLSTNSLWVPISATWPPSRTTICWAACNNN